jgi:hypothetical protein
MTANEIAQLTARKRDVQAMALTLCFLPLGLYVVFFTLTRFIEGRDIHNWTRNRIVMGTTLLHMIHCGCWYWVATLDCGKCGNDWKPRSAS